MNLTFRETLIGHSTQQNFPSHHRVNTRFQDHTRVEQHHFFLPSSTRIHHQTQVNLSTIQRDAGAHFDAQTDA